MNIDISLIIPVYNEKDNLILLTEKILAVMPKLKKTWELIFVDDGSTDGSQEIIKRIDEENTIVKAVYLTRNFGQTAALAAGIDAAQGKIIVTLDADMQNDPEDIPLLLEHMAKEKVDVVSGWRRNRKDPRLRSLFSNTANKLIALTTGVKLHDTGCTLKVYRREVLQNLALYGEMHRFLPALAAIQGFLISEIPVRHHPRMSGQSKYGLSRTIKVLLDLLTIKFLTSYQTKPIYMFGGIGFILLLFGFLSGCFIFIRRVFFNGIWVSPMLFITILLLIVGIQFILMGLIAEIQIRTWYESTNKKSYQLKRGNG